MPWFALLEPKSTIRTSPFCIGIEAALYSQIALERYAVPLVEFSSLNHVLFGEPSEPILRTAQPVNGATMFFWPFPEIVWLCERVLGPH